MGGWMCIMNWQGCRRKWQGSILLLSQHSREALVSNQWFATPLGIRKIFQVVYGKISVVAYFCLVLHDKAKVSQSHYTPLRPCGQRRYSSYTFMTSALDGGEWSASRPGHALAPGKGPPVPIVQEAGLVPEPVWIQRLDEKSFCVWRGSNLYCPVVQSIVRHYTDWAKAVYNLHDKTMSNLEQSTLVRWHVKLLWSLHYFCRGFPRLHITMKGVCGTEKLGKRWPGGTEQKHEVFSLENKPLKRAKTGLPEHVPIWPRRSLETMY
jgi:hypothetical protein